MTSRGYGPRRPHRRASGVAIPDTQAEPIQRSEFFDMTGGIVLNKSAREIELNESPFIENIRFEDTGIRKDFGFRNLDTPAESKVLGLVDHKFIANEQLYKRLVRITRGSGGVLEFDVWNGATWDKGTTSSSAIKDVLLSQASTEGKLIVADGNTILAWQEVPGDTSRGDDFSPGNSITAEGEVLTATLSSANSQGGLYDVHFSITVAEIVPDPSDSHIRINLGMAVIHILDKVGTILEERLYLSAVRDSESIQVRLPDAKTGDSIKIKIFLVGKNTATVNVHGFVLSENGTAGITYNEQAPPADTFGPLSGSAPPARMIIPFRDRLIALQADNDPQKIAWPVDGDSTDWVGDGSGSAFLLDTRSDPIDELMAAGAVASNVLALFRRRSIMRIRETGNIELALSFEHWIEGLGTDARFSVQQVKDGVMFLGHDMIVYYFSGAVGPQPIGAVIQSALLNTISNPDDQEKIDSAYDSVYGDYFLGIPENGSPHITRLWIFDLNRFLVSKGQDIQWRTRKISAQRLAAVGSLR